LKLENIKPELVQIALDKVDGIAFEKFAQDFLSALQGRDFVPVGGVKDGGADGLYDSGNKRSYYQFTRQENHREKIRKTFERLKGFGREVKNLYYLTSRLIPHIDKEEDLLSEELDINVRIRDRKYILSHINDSIGTISSYNNHLSNYTIFLNSLNSGNVLRPSAHVSDPTAYVFLQHEISNRLGNRKIIHSLTDSMILYALSETDPDKGIFMSEEEISSLIYEKFPWSKRILKGHIKKRLEIMRKKDISGREVRWYRKEKKYCLPYSTRQIIKEENQADEILQSKFIDEIKLIASGILDEDDGVYELISDVCLEVIHSVFEKQGLLFSHFISSEEKNAEPLIVADCIDDILDRKNIPSRNKEKLRECIEETIRKTFYHSSPTQREYLATLSRTYVLLFTLQAEPRIIEYFNTMGASFRLYLGSDIIVKALSERYLDPEDQVARNMLKMSAQSGMELYLTECVLDEVYTHIRGTYYEFINYFSEIESHITRELARNSDKILIRSYFYAKDEGKVNGWKNYLGQFLTYRNIGRPEGREELKKYLLSEYNLTFIDNHDLESVSKSKDVEALAGKLLDNDDKKKEELAYNSALLVYGIYGQRSKNKETNKASEFGLKTWWVTNQTRILKHTTNVVKKYNSYMMRPEYILNFISMSPGCENVRDSFTNIFPSVFGIQLGHRLKEDAFHKVMSDVQQWKEYEPGRITALMSDLSDRLKADRLKRYQNTL
jgi:hypothetical protein